jgi:hypothetical protein
MDKVMPAIGIIHMAKATLTSWTVAAMLALVLCHAQVTFALPAVPPPNAAVEIAKKSYHLSIALTIMGIIMVVVATVEFFFRMKDRMAARRHRVDTNPPRNPVNDMNGAHAHAMLGHPIYPGEAGEVHNIAPVEFSPIAVPAMKHPAIVNPSPMPSERPSHVEALTAGSNGASGLNSRGTEDAQ